MAKKMTKNWTKVGQELDKNQLNNVQIMANNWTKIGQKFAKQ